MRDGPVLRLTRRSQAAILVFCVALFLVVQGPIWRHAFTPDASILTSYAPIPVLVLAFLLYEKKLTVGSFLAETLLLAILKFGITATILVSIWAILPVPRPVRTTSAPTRLAPVEPTPAPEPTSAFPPGSTSTISGVVLTAADRPARGALVFVAFGLQSFRWSVPAEPARLSIASRGFDPTVLVVRARQTLLVSSADGRLHTCDVRDAGGRTLMNAPILASGAGRALRLDERGGVYTVRCDVHPSETAMVVVLTHPFHTRVSDDGRYELPGVPIADIELAALAPASPPSQVRVRVAPVARQGIRLVLPD